MFYGIGLITGLIIGYFLNSLVSKIKKGVNVSLFGYQLTISKKIEIVEPKKKYSTIHFEKG